MERIICSAIRFKTFGVDGVNVAGKRHSDCFKTFNELTGLKGELYQPDWGFLTSLNRFVDKIEAASIAYSANQTDMHHGLLKSEHLY